MGTATWIDVPHWDAADAQQLGLVRSAFTQSHFQCKPRVIALNPPEINLNPTGLPMFTLPIESSGTPDILRDLMTARTGRSQNGVQVRLHALLGMIVFLR